MGKYRYTTGLLAIIALMLFLNISPALTSSMAFAADDESDQQQENNKADDKEEDDEITSDDIEEGTVVNGVDISELSDEELQYVPKAWRDGSGGDSHPNADEDEAQSRSTFSMTPAPKASYPDVNDYIESNNLPEIDTVNNHKSALPDFNYRHGFGEPEGVVAHETANNSSTIDSEIAFMMNNYNNAFVHAFVDDQHVKEVHSTDRAAWGAGPYANERFIHIELVRTHSFDAFARSINNYSAYIARLLNKYDLGVSEAQPNGSGTLWAHRHVTDYLGGTTHTDPIGYFHKWGYSWDEFMELVKKKYDNLPGQVKPSDWSGQNKIGGLKSNDVKIHKNMDASFDDVKRAGEKYTDKLYYVTTKVKRAGKTYYLLNKRPDKDKKVIGWVQEKDITLYKQPSFKGKTKTFKLKDSAVTYDRPWPSKDHIAKNFDAHAGSYVNIQGTRKIGTHKWHEGEIDGEKVWIRNKHVADKDINHYPDVPSSSVHYDNIYELTSRNVIQGVPTENGIDHFRPRNSVSREQTAAIFKRELDLPVPENISQVLNVYNDVDSTHLYASEIAAVHEADIFRGSEGEFMYQDPLSREQMASVIVKAYNLEDTGEETDINLNNISSPHKDNVKILSQHGITDELEDFRPSEDTRREQFVTFINRTMNR